VHFLTSLNAITPQLTPLQCWYRILSEAMKKYLKGAVLKTARFDKLRELNAQHNSIFLVKFMLIFIGRDMFNYGFKVH